jgi:dipeptidyl aminopeptidase/acylaminoacyl peptidase
MTTTNGTVGPAGVGSREFCGIRSDGQTTCARLVLAQGAALPASCRLAGGVYDLLTFFGEGNAWRLVPHYFGGYPWQAETRRILERESPLTHVEAIKTPLLIQHGDNDRRTGFVQSEMLLRSLKVMGRDVEAVRYPRASHEMSRAGEPKQRLDSLVRYEEFFRRYLGAN